MIAALRLALRATRPPWADVPLEPLADTGLAHLHVRLAGTGVLARLPKQSQLDLPAAAHLAYEAACFERAAASGHTPRLHGVLPPSPGLPRGGLLVDEIAGRQAQLPGDLPALADALAALHALPLPAAGLRPPLIDPPDMLAALRDEIGVQARHLDAAGIDPGARRRIDDELRALDRLCEQAARPTRQLIAFDAHPGNFIVRDDGSACLVDLEKARYGPAALDLAHATLYTSTTWDLAKRAVLARDEVLAFHRRWLAQMPGAEAHAAWLLPLRRAMWLWSVTWCAKWRVLSGAAARGADGEDWSADLSPQRLVAHVRDRVDHYLSPAGVAFVCDEAEGLSRL
jgi:hypothetical protein